MSPKCKAKKGSSAATAVTQKNSARQPAHKSQPQQTYSPTTRKDTSELDRTLGNPGKTETSLNSVMDMLMDLSIRLQATEHFMDEDRANKAVKATLREQSPSCSPASNQSQ